MVKRVIIGEVIILTACFLLAAFYHWDINPDNWTADNRRIVIGIYLGVAVFAYPIALVASSDVNSKPGIFKDYVGKEFTHKEKGKVKVTYLGLTEKDNEEVHFVRYTTLNDGHSYEEYLNVFQNQTTVDKVKLLEK